LDVVRAADQLAARRFKDNPQQFLVLGDVINAARAGTPRDVVNPDRIAGTKLRPLRGRDVPVVGRAVQDGAGHADTSAAVRRRQTVAVPLWAGRRWPSGKTWTASGSESGLHSPDAGQWEPVGMTRVARSRRRAMLFIVETHPWE
jgi:hypothetical protein